MHPERVIIHVGTNDLKSDSTAAEIADNILSLAKFVSNDHNEIIVSSIAPRNDKYNEKAKGVNSHLYKMIEKTEFGFITHNNLNVNKHLNKSKLHLNEFGVAAMVRNFFRILK